MPMVTLYHAQVLAGLQDTQVDPGALNWPCPGQRPPFSLWDATCLFTASIRV